MATIPVIYDPENRELRLPCWYFDQWRTTRAGVELISWQVGMRRNAPIHAGAVLATVRWGDGHEDVLVVPPTCQGVILKTNRSLKYVRAHVRPSQWLVVLQ